MSLRQAMARGAVWTILFRLIDRTLGLISTLILAHLLMPTDFGLVAMAMSLSAMLQLLTYFSFDIALLRERETDPAHFDAVWTLNVIAGCVIAILMLALAVPAAHFYHAPRLTDVILALAAAPFIQGFENVGIITFRKEMRFDRDFRFMFSRRIIKFAVAVGIAVWLRTYWALVLGILAGPAAGVIISYRMHSYRPRFSLASLGDLLHFTKWLMLQNVLTFLKQHTSDFVVGRLAGPGSLGLFSVAAEIADLPGTELVQPINRAVMPAYMKLAHDLPALRREYLSVMSVVALLAIPAVAGVALCAPFIVILFLGPKWLPAAGVLEILAFYGITRVVQSNAYSAYLALGKPHYIVGISSVNVVALIGLLIALTMRYGLHGAAWAYLLASAITLPIDFYFIIRFMGVRVADYVSNLWRPICSATIMYFTVRSVTASVPSNLDLLSPAHAAYSLVTYVVIGAFTYSIADVFLWLCVGRPVEGAETLLIGRVRALLALRFGSRHAQVK